MLRSRLNVGGNDEAARFITGLTGLMATWPFSAYAHQRSGVRRIGVFLGLATGPEDPGTGEILRPLRASMQEVGWTEGKNVSFDVRFGGGNLAKMGVAADELVALAPDQITRPGCRLFRRFANERPRSLSFSRWWPILLGSALSRA